MQVRELYGGGSATSRMGLCGSKSLSLNSSLAQCDVACI